MWQIRGEYIEPVRGPVCYAVRKKFSLPREKFVTKPVDITEAQKKRAFCDSNSSIDATKEEAEW
jgi:hypothetical protein